MERCFRCKNMAMRIEKNRVRGVCTAMDEEDQKQYDIYDIQACCQFEPYKQVKKDGKAKNFNEIVLEVLDEMRELFQRKNNQYGIGDPLANFRDGAAAMGLNPESLDDCFIAGKGYKEKHTSFIQRSKELTPKVCESLGDEAMYDIISIAMARMKEQQN